MLEVKEQLCATDGYKVVKLPFSAKRVCLTLDLKNDPELIKAYVRAHNEDYWPEIGQGIEGAGITIMDIYLVENRMFMICELPEDMDFQETWNKIGTYPKQSDWEKFMSKFQQPLPGYSLKWVPMDRIYSLDSED